MLMHDGKILKAALAETRASESDILNKLRGANIKELSEVQLMVLESTGDISILSGPKEVDDEVMKEVDCCHGPLESHIKRQG